jgi:hypothetical protein
MNALNLSARWLAIVRRGLLALCGMLCGLSQLQAQALQAAEGAAFKNVELLPDQTNDGLKGIAVKFELTFKSVMVAGAAAPYYLEARVLDEYGQPIAAASNAKGYADLDGFCRDSMPLTLAMPDASGGEQALFLPYFALGLPVGPNHIKVRLLVIDQRSRQVLARTELLDLRFQKPRMKLYRMRVDRIEAFTTDADGETWDYKFLNARDIYPELIWSLRRGHHDVFESPKQKNDTIYVGNAEDMSPWIWLSEGDRIHFYVRDFDLLGYSDLVGSLGIDIWQAGFQAGRAHALNFERVRQAQVMQEAIDPPKVSLTGFEVIENDRQAGMTGTRIKLEYAVDQGVKGSRFILGARLRFAGGSVMPQMLRVIGPGAVPLVPGVVELTAQRSNLELFVPHFALPDSLLARAMLQVEAGIVLDDQGFVLTRQQRQLLETGAPVDDMVYGQWKVGVHEVAGRGGLRLTLDYELPEAYFQDLGKAQIALVPAFQASWGAIDNKALEVLGDEAGGWDGQELHLDAATRQGSLDLFLPFAACPPGGGNTLITARYKTQLQFGGRSIALGAIERQSAVELPTLLQLQLGLREASVVRRQWILSHPSMYWELRCGSKLLHRSQVVPEQRNARWPDSDLCQWVVAQSDRIEVRVYHKVTDGEPDRLLDMWTGQLADLPNRIKGNVRLQTDDLKKMLLHLEYQEPGHEDGRTRGGHGG